MFIGILLMVNCQGWNLISFVQCNLSFENCSLNLKKKCLLSGKLLNQLKAIVFENHSFIDKLLLFFQVCWYTFKSFFFMFFCLFLENVFFSVHWTNHFGRSLFVFFLNDTLFQNKFRSFLKCCSLKSYNAHLFPLYMHQQMSAFWLFYLNWNCFKERKLLLASNSNFFTLIFVHCATRCRRPLFKLWFVLDNKGKE